MKKFLLYLLTVVAFTSCHSLKKIVAGKDVAIPGDAHIVYTYTDDNRKPADTLVVNGLGNYVYSYEGQGYQREFLLPVYDTKKKDTIKKNLKTWHIVYAKIKSLDGKDSIEYVHSRGETYRVIKRRGSVKLLYRTQDYYSPGATPAEPTVTGVDYSLLLLKNGKQVEDVDLTFTKRRLVKFINERYKQTFNNKDFEGSDQAFDYIMDMESKSED